MVGVVVGGRVGNALRRLFCPPGVLLLVFLPVLARAQIALEQDLGSVASKTPGTSISLVVPNAVPAGRSILLAFAMDDAGTVGSGVAATDSAGNVYTADADVINNGDVRTVILVAHGTSPLSPGDSITVSHPSVTARALAAAVFVGLDPIGALDRTRTGKGSGTVASSGSTSPTRHPVELLFGVIGVEGPPTESFTPGAGYTALSRGGTTGGSATSNITVNPEWRVVTVTGNYEAPGTLGTSRKWAAALATYREAMDASRRCFLVADSGGGAGGNDLLAHLDKTASSTDIPIGPGLGTDAVEAIAYRLSTGVLYGANASQLGVIDVKTGAFTATSSPFGTGSGSVGNLAFSDVDGLSFDPTTGVLYGSHRRGSADDVLLQIDPATGAHVDGAFGGDDYVVIGSTAVVGLGDIDDIAVDLDGQMYAIANNGGLATGS